MAASNTSEKKPNILARLSRTFRDMKGEMKRVVWPTRKQTIHNTIIVIVFMIIMAIIIGTFDAGLSALIRLFFAG